MLHDIRTFDRDIASVKSLFKRAKKLERTYGTLLRKVAGHVGDIAKMFDASTDEGIRLMRGAMLRYADGLHLYAEATAERIVTEIAAADRESWRRASTTIGRLLHKEIESAPTGIALRDAKARQVTLIKSLPLEAAERVQRLTTEGLASGRRTSAIVDDILATGHVTRSRATLIARTEVSRTATELTKARAEHVGSTHFIWRTAGDGAVRPSHRKLNGQSFRWDQPPECDPGHHALPGGIWNCRCFPEPIISLED